MRRRSVLLGLGTAAAGSGIAFGSGAFTQVQASRDISIGVSTDENALVELKANPEIQSVFQNSEGELAVDTSRLSSDNKGFNVGSTVQIGATTESFGDTVDMSNPAFEIINRFDDSSENSSDFDGTIDIGVDLTAIVPDDEDQINALEFIASKNGIDDGNAESSEVVKAGDRKVLTGLEPAGSDGDDDRVAVAIRAETSNTSGEFSVDDAIVIQAGSDLTAGDFPNEQAAPGGTVENQNTGATFSDIATAVNDANTDETLIVGPGDYEESVTIDVEGLTLEGAGADSSTIVGQNSLAVTSTAPNVEIAGFRIENPGGSRAVRVTDDATGVVIQNNTVTNVNTENNANQPRGIVVGGLDGGDSADGLEIKNNTVTKVEGADPDKEQAHAIQILEESNGGGLIENVTVDGNTIDDILDTRSTVAVNFNGNIEGEITNNNISGLNTEGQTDSGDPGGFTQVIALNKGGNASSGPQNVDISGNKISNIETTTDENFAPPFHIIIGGDADGGTISIDSNEFNADSPDTDVYLSDGTSSINLENVTNDNNFDTEPVLSDLNGDDENEAIVPPDFE